MGHHGKSKEEIRKYRQKQMAELMKITRVDSDTQYSALDEAQEHLMDHFNPPHRPEFQHDHVLIIGGAYFGESVEHYGKNVMAAACYMTGDTHALSHSIADHMHENLHFAKVIFHAMEVYALHGKE